MQQIFGIFGIDWRLLLINTINFALVLFVLWYFFYGPLMRMLETRRQKVAQGVRDAEEAAARLREVARQKEKILGAAGKEADELLDKARVAAAAREREMLAHSERLAAGVVSEAALQAEELKAQALEESRQEVAKLVVLGVEKMLAKK